MGKINSRAKGCRGEREFRDLLRAQGVAARRGQQHRGGADSPDVITGLDARVSFEVKRVERFNAYEAMAQATRDAGPHRTPVVAHKRNGMPWLCVIPAEVLVELLKQTGEYEEHVPEAPEPELDIFG